MRAKSSVGGPEAAEDIRDTTLVKEGDLFMLADLEGNAPPRNHNGLGLYYRDTRFLSAYDLEIEGLRPTILLSSGRWHFLGVYVLTNPNLVTEEGGTIPKETIQIRRHRAVRARRLSESLTFQNFNPFAVAMEIGVHVDADFADIFDVRGFASEGVQRRLVQAEVTGAAVTFRYDGRDRVRRSTRVSFDPAPVSLAGGVARYRLDLLPHALQRVAVEIDVAEDPIAEEGAPPPAPADAAPGASSRRWLDGAATVQSSNGLFNAIFAQARADERALLGGGADAPFLAAGIPWYAALFGRDSLISALSDLWTGASLAKHTLVQLGRAQGRRDDPWRDEEPGKILHESRRGELAGAGIVPFGPYFGTVDATPLWVLVLGQYHRATGDLALVRELLPNLEAALAWIDRHGDIDGDGFVEYRSRSTSGLTNQGWKDSWDGIVHADGTLPEPPIALVEVQAYVYAAKRGAAAIFRALGDPARALALEAEAARLKDAFEAAFWMPDRNFYCLALDGKKRQVRAIASNPGHALLCGIAAKDRAARVAERLMDEDMYSGFGVRTLSNREARYNPVGYHIGTVWPHDNALIALGLKRYGLVEHAVEIASGLFDAAQHFPGYRTPELFCGFARSAFGVPVRYPVACNPQAWAATSWSMLLQAILGVSADAVAGELSIVSPALPSWLHWVEVDRIPVGKGSVDLRYERVGERTAVDVVAMRGDVRVTFIERWPEGA